MERKKLIELIGSVFVAAIFLSSYAAFGSVAPGGTASGATSVPPSQTFYATASGNATITSYSGVMNVNIACENISSVSSRLNAALQLLERNGSVNNFYSQRATQILVQAGNLSTYPLYLLLYNDTGTYSACINFTTTANIRLPDHMTFYIPSEGSKAIIAIPAGMQMYSVPLTLSRNMSSTMNVTASTILALNGSIYSTVRVSQA